MSTPGTPLRVAGFLLGLLAVFAAAFGLGRLVGPLDAASYDGMHGQPAAHVSGEETGHGR
jgi:hypothetical protein